MSKQFPHPFGDIASRYRAVRRKLPAKVSTLAATTFKQNFRDQGLRVSKSQVIKWPKRHDRSDRGRAILIKTGRLRRAIRPQPSYDSARVVNATPYAAIHNRGGVLKGAMRAWSTNLKTGLLRLRRNSGHQAMMPARPYMVTTPFLMDKVTDMVKNDLSMVFTNSKSE